MDVEQVLHMVGGEGDGSYANNSLLQKLARDKIKSMVEQAVVDAYASTSLPKMVVADLGCSSGPNTFVAMAEIIKTISKCSTSQRTSAFPEVQLVLNDLPGNDFNSIFRSIPALRTSIKNECDVPVFVCGVPGSYFERLFPQDSVHFVHSSYSLHFLSQVPQFLQSKAGDASLNKKNIYLAKTSPPELVDSYVKQFQKDFSLFLSLRSKELVCGGRMVLLLLGRRSPNATDGECCNLWGSLAEALNEMVLEGLVDEADRDGFNMPIYTPSLDEIRAIVQHEGSFLVEDENIFEMHWDPAQTLGNLMHDSVATGLNVAKYLRAVAEPMFKAHFTAMDMDQLFSRYAKKIEALPKEITKYANVAVALKKQR